jgi:hypothetical protein
MSVLPQIAYGNMALIALSYFHGYKKMNFLQIIGINYQSTSSPRKKIDFFKFEYDILWLAT